MTQSNGSQASQNSSQNTSQGKAQSGGSSNQNGKMIIYVLIGIIVVVILGIALLYVMSLPASGSSSLVTVAQNHSANSTAIYMGPYQSQLLLGSKVSSYNTSDLYNPGISINISYLESEIPSLQGNVSSGWITSAFGSNQSANASLEFLVLQGSNAAKMSSALSSFFAASLNMSPEVVSPGYVNGFNYSYSVYKNSTANVQIVSGWRNNNAVLLYVQSSSSFTANEMQMVNAAANET